MFWCPCKWDFLFFSFFFIDWPLQLVRSEFSDQGWTWAPAVVAPGLNHWATRELPSGAVFQSRSLQVCCSHREAPLDSCCVLQPWWTHRRSDGLFAGLPPFPVMLPVGRGSFTLPSEHDAFCSYFLSPHWLWRQVAMLSRGGALFTVVGNTSHLDFSRGSARPPSVKSRTFLSSPSWSWLRIFVILSKIYHLAFLLSPLNMLN